MVTTTMKLKYVCSFEEKAMTNLDSILKNRDITLPSKVHIIKAIVFPVVRYGCESWTIKKTKPQRIDVFKLWYWRRLLEVSWTARGSNQSILKNINSEYSVNGLMLKRKLQYFGQLSAKSQFTGKYPDAGLGNIEGKKRRDQQMIRWLDGNNDSMDMSFSKFKKM